MTAFGAFSSNPSALTDNGHDNSLGYGARIGYLGDWSETFSVGASYQTKISMGAFDNYAGLFAEEGAFDIPAVFTVGVAVRPVESVDVVFDYQRMNYSQITAIAAPLLPNLMMAPLGTDDGAGFGWQDVNAYKAGVELRATPQWTFRGGYSYSGQPIPESEMIFNILAPGVVEQHATFGVSYSLGETKGIHFSVTRAFPKSVTGPNNLEAPGAQMIGLEMNQWDLEFGYSFGF